jgi:energy-coupling factor transport system ATP-binding protein
MAVQVLDLSYRYPGASAFALRSVSLSVNQGECVCLAGPSGSGKSTLLLAMSGLLKGGERTGESRLADTGSIPFVGIVFQNAESQILSTTVQDEVAFGPTNLNVPPDEINERVRRALEAVGLSGYETRNVEELSAGEKHRLTLASVISMEPCVLFLDEPTAQLDAQGKEALRTILKDLKERLYTIVVADHDVRPYRDLADRFLLMDRGAIEGETNQALCTEMAHVGLVDNPPEERLPRGQRVVGLDNVYFSRQQGQPVITDLSMEIHAGERVHVCGSNGAGKSTLFKLMTGLLRPDSGTIDMLGLSRPKPETLRGKVGLLLQNPVRQLFEETVYGEVAFSLKRQGLSQAEIGRRTVDALSLCDVLNLRDRSPLTLSYGEKHRVTLASMIALRPRVLLLDEPFSGLDFEFRRRMLDTLKGYGKQHDCAMIVSSHDPLVDARWADRSFLLQGGRLTEPSAT